MPPRPSATYERLRAPASACERLRHTIADRMRMSPRPVELLGLRSLAAASPAMATVPLCDELQQLCRQRLEGGGRVLLARRWGCDGDASEGAATV